MSVSFDALDRGEWARGKCDMCTNGNALDRHHQDCPFADWNMAKQDKCDHKFIGSKNCLKCGWTPIATAIAARLQPLRVVEPALTDEERAERAWEREYPVNNKLHRFNEDAVRDVYIGWKAGYLAARKERGK